MVPLILKAAQSTIRHDYHSLRHETNKFTPTHVEQPTEFNERGLQPSCSQWFPLGSKVFL